GAVEERQTFLRAEGDRLNPRNFEATPARQAFAAIRHFTFAQKNGAHMRQRGKVSGCAYRAFLRDAGVNLCIEQADQGLDHLKAYAGIAAGQTVYLEEKEQPYC